MRILTTYPVFQTHPAVFEMIRERHTVLLPEKNEEMEAFLSGQDWEVALLPQEALTGLPENALKGKGPLLCYVDSVNSSCAALFSRNDVDEIWTGEMVDFFFLEKIRKLEKAKQQAVSPASLFDFIHDLRTPLTVIYTTLEILLLKRGKENEEAFVQKIKSCRAHLDRIKVMVANSVDTVRLNDFHVNKADEEVTELIRSVLSSQAPRFDSEEKFLVLDTPPVLFPVDRNIFRQMIHNMLEHYLLFADSKTTSEIILKKKEASLTVTLSYQGGGWLDEKEIKAIFEKGERIIDKKKGVKYNKGFGFTYNRRLAALLGGSFDLLIDPATLHHTLCLKLV